MENVEGKFEGANVEDYIDRLEMMMIEVRLNSLI